jgi:hypothetical protein
MSQPSSGWIVTYTGRRFWPLNPRVEDLDIRDIAHGLSNICRFTGQCRTFYSVAEHCLRASFYVPEYLQLAMLLHDASEAYLCDVSRPVKHAPGMLAYRLAEANLMHAISVKFGVEFSDPLIHETDNRMLMTERRDLMAPEAHSWDIAFQCFAAPIHPYPPVVVEDYFLTRFENLTRPVITEGVCATS